MYVSTHSLRRLGLAGLASLTLSAGLFAQPTVTPDAGTLTYNENAAATPVSPGLTVTSGQPTGFFANITISANFASGQDTLSFTNDGSTMGNIASAGFNTSSGILILFSSGGTATIAEWQAALRAVSYANSSDDPSTATRTVGFELQDGSGLNSPANRAVAVTAVNDAPTITAPGSISVTEDVATALTGISFADVDAGSNSVTATLSVGSGTLAGASGGGVTVSGSGTTSLTLAGTIADLNTFISGSNVAFTTALNSTASVTLGVGINDGGNTGSGGAQSAAQNVTLTVSAVNDAPTITAPGSIAVTEDVATALTGISFADVDAGSNSVTATLSVGSGTLAGTSGGGVTVSGSGTTSLTLAGTIANLNTFISGSNVTFTTALNSTASVTLGVAINDGGNTGSGGAQSASQNVTLTVNAVNDAPVNTVPGAQTTNVNVPRTFNAANSNLISIADVDAGSNPLAIALNSTNGTAALNAGALGGLNFVSGNGTASVVFTGTLAALNAALDGLVFTPTANFTGAASLQIFTNDQGDTDTDTIAITVNSVPSVVSVSSTTANGAYTVGGTIAVTVTFSEAVTVNTAGGTPTILLETGAVDRTASYASGSGTSTLTFNYTVQAGDTAADLDYASTSALVLNGGTITNAVPNNAVLTLPTVGGGSSLGGQKNIVIDTTGPVVSSVAVPANGTYGTGQNLNFTVNFSEAVTVNTAGGTPRLAVTLDTGGTVYASYLSGTGTTALLFRYTVASGNADPTGIALAAALDANGGTLRDAAANNATLTLNSVGATAGVLVDGVVPTVVSSVRANASPTNATSFGFTVTFSEGVTGVDAADFQLTATGTAAGTVSAVAPSSASVYVVTVSGVTGTGTLRLDLKSTGTGIADLAANAIAAGFTAGEAYTIDNAPPVVSGASTATTTYNTPFSYTATANKSPVTFSAVGLPPGLAISSGGVITGATAATGTFTGFVRATDTFGNIGVLTVTITVNPALAPVIVGNLAQTYNGQPRPVTVTTIPADLPVTVTYGGSATVPVNAGTYAVAATLNPGNYIGSGNGTLVVAKASQIVTFPAPGGVAINAALALAASASTGLPVTYSLVSGNATLAGATLTLRDALPVTVRATQAGDQNHAPASADLTLSAGKLAQTIAFAPLSERRADDPAFALAATASSGLPVTFSIVSGPASLAGSLLTLSGAPGTVVVRAAQPGDDSYSPAASVDRAFEVALAPVAERLINLSTRGPVNLAAGRPLIAGFVIAGPAAKRLLLRATGPALAAFGVTDAAPNPRLQVLDGTGRVVLDNDDWSGAEVAAAAAQNGAFALAAGSRDAAAIATLAPGAYTMQVLDSGSPGTVLAEVYDLDAVNAPQRVINLSARGAVEPGAPFIDGFVIAGRNPRRVLIRAVGPALAAFGVAGALADPRIAVFSGATLVAQNDDWSVPQPVAGQPAPATAAEIAAAAAAAGAFALPAGSRDAAVVVTLAPGAYTAQGAVSTGAGGTALVEIYELP